jgi:beta-lactam-binding protein with PASTA domain
VSNNDAGERVLAKDTTPAPQGRGRAAGTTAKSKRKQVRTFLVLVVEVLAIAGALLATSVLAAAISFTLAVRSNEITVPDLTGNSLEGARDTLSLNELQLVLSGNRFDESVPPDFIALQTPAPGTALKKGRSIRVWVSLGPRRRTVPRIEGESLQSAQLILEQSGFSLGRVVEIHSDIYAPDTVVAQAPQAYEEVGDESVVSVLMSRGYLDPAFVMPDFIGRDYVDLLQRLSRGPLKVSQVRNVDYPGVPKNIVVRQTPAAGTKVYRRDRIVLYLSKGP